MASVSIDEHFADPRVHRLFYPTLAPFAAAAFIGAFLSDLAYWRTAEIMWERFSIWLLTFGLVMMGFAIAAGLIDLIRAAPAERRRAAVRVVAGAAIFGLSSLNALIHSRDAYTAIVPWGVSLSSLVVLMLLVNGWASRRSSIEAKR